jgi:hypothetical protein
METKWLAVVTYGFSQGSEEHLLKREARAFILLLTYFSLQKY